MVPGLIIAVMVHGPEAVDSGLALEVIGKAMLLGEVKASVGGATAVAAVIDANLEDTISIASKELPSAAIRRMVASADLIIMVNLGKDRTSSTAFGQQVMAKVPPSTVPIIQVDDGITVLWNGTDDSLSMCNDLLKGEVMDMRGTARPQDPNFRELSGVRPGEPVWVNGNVIGRATSERVRIFQGRSGDLRAEGLEVKPAGVERLGRFELRTAIIRSGQVRRTASSPRSLHSQGKTAFLIDHCAEDSVFRCRGAAYVVTVGDDTSKIASALLYRLGVPVMAITDGDEDGISGEELFYPGSYLFRLEPGNDDQVGALVRKDLFKNGDRVEDPASMEDMAARVRALCGKKLLWERRF